MRVVEFLRTGGVNPPVQAIVETAGWGSVDNLVTRPDTLQELQVEMLSSRRCGRSDYFGSKFTENMMCAHKVCVRPACNLPFNTMDTCDVSLSSIIRKREARVSCHVIILLLIAIHGNDFHVVSTFLFTIKLLLVGSGWIRN